MKLSVIALASACLCLASQAGAALAPKYQRLAELKAIANSTAIVDAFPEEALVEAIFFVERDLYRVVSGQCAMDVRIVDQPSPGDGWVGPRQFRLEPGKVTCGAEKPGEP